MASIGDGDENYRDSWLSLNNGKYVEPYSLKERQAKSPSGKLMLVNVDEDDYTPSSDEPNFLLGSILFKRVNKKYQLVSNNEIKIVGAGSKFTGNGTLVWINDGHYAFTNDDYQGNLSYFEVWIK